jgi:tRNA nucleotidyltransferase (CCA-adding enzyme)
MALIKEEIGWHHFPHGADIGVRGVGETKAAAFEQAACAMTAVMTKPVRVESRQAIEVSCSAPDDGLLLVDWLNALIYEMATRHMLFGRFEVAIDGGELRATAWGEPIDVERHEPAVEIKGATMTALEVARRPDGLWLAQCIVDV